MNKKYMRVLPRDLFNEAKLLKCIGQLVLLIEDRMAPEGLAYEHTGTPFEIGLYDAGYLGIKNMDFNIGDHVLLFYTTYNSTSNYPLTCMNARTSKECEVFDDKGKLTQEFIDFCNTLNK